jgi:hypothetical protein
MVTKEEFEKLLNLACDRLAQEVSKGRAFQNAKDFENRSREVITSFLDPQLRAALNVSPNPQEFPDIVIGQFGVEVKFTAQDTWRSVANSILESTRSPDVQHIYVLFGKMGGKPLVRWGEYAKCVMHVRTSHVPRFELEIGATRSLFDVMGVDYESFSVLPLSDKMRHVREGLIYSRFRSEFCFWADHQGEFGGHLLVRAPISGGLSPSDGPRSASWHICSTCPPTAADAPCTDSPSRS